MGLPASALKPGAEGADTGTPMTLTLGPDFTKAGVPVAAPEKIDVGRSRADEKMCEK